MGTVDGKDLRPLTRAYTREPAVITDITSLCAVSSTEFWQRVAITDYRVPGCPHLESLVYWLRCLHQRGETEAAWRIGDVLVERVKRTIARRLASWRSLSADQREEIEHSLIVTLYTEWFSDAPAHEFWEVRFGVCLERAISDEIDRHHRVAEREMVLTPLESEDGGTTDPWESIPDAPVMDAETAAVVSEALDYLGEPLRTTFYLYHYEGWSEETIAQYLSVTSRTVRNYLRRADGRLEKWRGAEKD